MPRTKSITLVLLALAAFGTVASTAHARTEISGNWSGTDNMGFTMKVDIKSSFRRGLTAGHIAVKRHIEFIRNPRSVLRYRSHHGNRWRFDLPNHPGFTVDLKRDGDSLRANLRYDGASQRTCVMERTQVGPVVVVPG